MTTKETIAKFSSQVLTSSEVRAYTVELLQSVLDGLPEDSHVADAGASIVYDAGWNDCKKVTELRITSDMSDLKEGK